MNPSILIADDDSSVVASLSYLFRKKGYEVYEAGNGRECLQIAEDENPDVLLVDYKLPDMSGVDAISKISAMNRDSVIIIMTGYGSIKGAVEAMSAGAFDYLPKPVDLDTLEIAVERALEIQGLKKENRLLKGMARPLEAEGLIGESPQIHKLTLIVNLLAENKDTTVLIEGESGTGKEVVARIIHRMSPRRDKPFMDINCAALPETLLESELFGHEKGAFTDAKSMKRGLMEVADGGTLFLDEVGELALSLQPKLLRVLETRKFRRVGGTKDISSDVRFIAATNKTLKDSVDKKEFREDLYYRLRVMPLTLPPLKERGRDVLLLANHFLHSMNIGGKKKIKGFSPDCEKYLMSYSWPGNIRELRNVVERAVILCEGPTITPEYLSLEPTADPAGIIDAAGFADQAAISLAPLEEVEKVHIMRVMKHTEGNQSQASRMLGISRSTLINKLKKYGELS
jgi:DNA-binding NtrC family response regulator